MKSQRRMFFVTVVIWLPAMLCGTSMGVPVVYLGSDFGAGPGEARPDSDATAATFDAAAGGLGAMSVLDFEVLPVGNFGSMAIAPGVTATLQNTDGTYSGISTSEGVTTGYNTTAGGAKHLHVTPIYTVGTASVVFDFDSPIYAFGAYLIGVGTANGNLHVVFDAGGSQDISVVGDDLGGAQFFGFTSAGNSIVSVGMEMREVFGYTRDAFGVDDMRYVPVPEPATIALIGFGALALRGRRR